MNIFRLAINRSQHASWNTEVNSLSDLRFRIGQLTHSSNLNLAPHVPQL